MKVSELQVGEYGIFRGAIIIKDDKGFIIACNHEVECCTELPWDADLDELKGIARNKEFIIQYDSEIELVTAENLERFIRTAVINNKDTNYITITRI